MNDMVALRSILCPIDFSEQSRHALQWAEALARRTKGRLTVLSAVDPLLAEAARVRFGLDLARAETEPALRQFVAATWSDDLARATNANFDVRVGHSADVILETAARERTDLIVMGTHGLGGVRKWLLGSTTERVLRRTHTPVLAVPPTVSELRPSKRRYVRQSGTCPGRDRLQRHVSTRPSLGRRPGAGDREPVAARSCRRADRCGTAMAAVYRGRRSSSRGRRPRAAGKTDEAVRRFCGVRVCWSRVGVPRIRSRRSLTSVAQL